jgi:class 3 adenylate cyclase
MQSVPEWLKSLDLSQYAELFAGNDLDFDLIDGLSEQDLEKLGVSSMGHRKRLLKAIAERREGSSAQPQLVSSNNAPAPASNRELEGERRQLTVLFCDLVGFTELASRLDPEVLQGIVRSYEDTCAACVTRYEGYVFQRLGDGIVAFFGYPLAHEGEAERAVHAGLAVIESLSKLDVAEAGHLSVRIGIATGLVVVSSAEKGAVGETMNLAARLQAIA